MKITVLDGNALNPGDLSWDSLKEFGQVKVYPRTNPDEVVERIADSEIILLNKININEEILSKCPSLKYIGVQATGYNVIDIDACKRHGVAVTNVPSYSTAGVSQMVFAYILTFACKVDMHSRGVFDGEWCKSPDFCYWKAPLTELEGKTLGVFGFGHIGQKVSQIAKAFGMKVLVTTRTYNPQIENPVDFDTLLKESDFLTLHAPLTDKTREIINRESLKKMKKSAFLINTARGALVNEEDVSSALLSEQIAGYACDVLSEEPMQKDNPLLKAKNCIITPHIAWAARESRQRLLNIVIENIRAFLNGKAQNLVT